MRCGVRHQPYALVQKLLEKNEVWFLTMPSIGDNKNYFYAKSKKTKKLLSDAMGVVFDGNIGSNDQVFLRKEIIYILEQKISDVVK